MICHYWYFLNGLHFEHLYAIDAMIYRLMMSMNLSNIAILKIESADYCYIINGINEDKAIILLQNIDFTEKMEHYKNLIKINIKSNF